MFLCSSNDQYDCIERTFVLKANSIVLRCPVCIPQDYTFRKMMHRFNGHMTTFQPIIFVRDKSSNRSLFSVIACADSRMRYAKPLDV